MRMIILSLLFLNFLVSIAALSGTLELDSKLSVDWPADAKFSVNYLGSRMGFLLISKNGKDKPITVNITSIQEALPINDTLVKLRWGRHLAQEESLGAANEDLDCGKAGKNRFVCERSAENKTGTFVSERHIWTEHSKRVSIRATSGINSEEAQRVLALFKVKII